MPSEQEGVVFACPVKSKEKERAGDPMDRPRAGVTVPIAQCIPGEEMGPLHPRQKAPKEGGQSQGGEAPPGKRPESVPESPAHTVTKKEEVSETE